MISDVKLNLVRQLREDGRRSLSQMSKKTGIPVTTLYDNYCRLVRDAIILRHFAGIRLSPRFIMFISVKHKDELFSFLKDLECINSIFVISEYDVCVDLVFKDRRELLKLIETLNSFELKKIKYHEVESQLIFEAFKP